MERWDEFTDEGRERKKKKNRRESNLIPFDLVFHRLKNQPVIWSRYSWKMNLKALHASLRAHERTIGNFSGEYTRLEKRPEWVFKRSTWRRAQR